MITDFNPQYRDELISFTTNFCALAGHCLKCNPSQLEAILTSGVIQEIISDKGNVLLIQSNPVLTLNLVAAEEGFQWLADTLSQESIRLAIAEFENLRFPPSSFSWAGNIVARYIVEYSSSFQDAFKLVPYEILLAAFPAYHTRGAKAAITDLYIKGVVQ